MDPTSVLAPPHPNQLDRWGFFLEDLFHYVEPIVPIPLLSLTPDANKLLANRAKQFYLGPLLTSRHAEALALRVANLLFRLTSFDESTAISSHCIERGEGGSRLLVTYSPARASQQTIQITWRVHLRGFLCGLPSQLRRVDPSSLSGVVPFVSDLLLRAEREGGDPVQAWMLTHSEACYACSLLSALLTYCNPSMSGYIFASNNLFVWNGLTTRLSMFPDRCYLVGRASFVETFLALLSSFGRA